MTTNDNWLAGSTLVRRFISCAWALILVTASLKLDALLRSSRELDLVSAVFPFLTNRQMLFCATSLEAAVLWLLIRIPEPKAQLLIILALGGVLGGYRIGLELLGSGLPCNCLGTLGLWLPLKSYELESLSNLALLFLLIPSALLLLLCQLSRRIMPAW